MTAHNGITRIFADELIGTPTPHSLALGKNVVIFTLKISEKFLQLKPGDIVGFEDDLLEVMNSYQVQCSQNYLKFNLVPRKLDEPA